jgi:hypothetical protein
MLPTVPITSFISWTGPQERSSQNSGGLVTKVEILRTPIASQLTRRVTSFVGEVPYGGKIQMWRAVSAPDDEQLRSKKRATGAGPPAVKQALLWAVVPA